MPITPITSGLGALPAFLLACSGGILNVGSNDAGATVDVIPVPEVSMFSAAAVEKASKVCSVINENESVFGQIEHAAYPTFEPTAAELRSDLSGGWVLCVKSMYAPDDLSFQFTPDGRWYVLADDGDGGLRRSRSSDSAVVVRGYDAGAMPYEGTYTFQDIGFRPVDSDGAAVVATGGASWFRPSFTTLMGQRVIVMDFTDSTQNVNVFVGP